MLHYRLVNLHTPAPHCGIAARGINNLRQIAGYSYNSARDAVRAVIWESSRITEIGTLGGRNSYATAIDDHGVVVGFSEFQRGGTLHHAFRFTGGEMQDIGTLGGAQSTATAIGRSGHIVGEAQTPTGAAHAFLWFDGEMQDLTPNPAVRSAAFALNGAGHVVGHVSELRGPWHAAAWIDGELRDLGTLGGASSSALGINDAGQVVGWTETASGALRAFLWDGDGMHDLGACGRTEPDAVSSARCINSSGRIAGYCAPSRDDRKAEATFDCAGAIFSLTDALEFRSGWRLRHPKAINDLGDIVGEGIVGDKTMSFLVTECEELVF